MARVYPETINMTMEDILEETGWGMYYKVLIGVVSACAFCLAAANATLSFALPLSTCDTFMNDSVILTVHLCFFLGKAIGGFLLNASSDITGKLWLLPNSLMLIFASTFLAAFSHTGTSLSVGMFALGSGLEANHRATRIILAEILPKRKRGSCLIIPTYFWTVGYILTIGCAWKLSYHAIVDHRGSDMRLTAWRVMFAIAGGCSIIVACVTALVQQSPRYRLLKNQYSAAQELLKLFYAINKSKYSETWPLREQDLNGIISDFQINKEPQPLNCTEQIRLLLNRIYRTTCLLFRKRFFSTTATLIIMKTLLFSGIIPMHLTLTKALVAGNETCEIFGHELLHLYPPVDHNCILQVDSTLFLTFILLALNILLGQVIVAILIDKIGRTFTIVFGSFICSTSGFILAYCDFIVLFQDEELYVKTLFISLFLTGYSIILHVVDVIEIEAFPTIARGTAAGVINFYPNFMFCVACTLWYSSCQVTYVSLGMITAAAIFVAYFLPEMKKRPMVE